MRKKKGTVTRTTVTLLEEDLKLIQDFAEKQGLNVSAKTVLLWKEFINKQK